MGDDDGRAILHKVLDSILNEAFGLGVERRSGFVEDEDRRVFEDSTSNRYALTLATREARTTVANVGLIAIGGSHDELVGIGNASGLFDFGLSGRFDAEGDIVVYGVVEEDGLLVDIAHEVT